MPDYDSDPLLCSSSIYGEQTPITTPSTASAYSVVSAHMEPLGYGRHAYHDYAGPFLNVGSAPMPEVTSFHPDRGGPGQRLAIYLKALYELVTSTPPVFHVMLGQSKSRASLVKVSQSGGVCQYEVATEVPSFPATRWSVSRVPIRLLMESADGDMLAKLNVGDYNYLEGGSYDRKRKASLDYGDVQRQPVKRTMLSMPRAADDFLSHDYYSMGSYDSYLTPNPAHYASMVPQQQVRPHSHYPVAQASRSTAYPSSRPSSSASALRTALPLLNTWSPLDTALSAPLPRSSAVSSGTSGTSSTTPQLIRTSTISQTAHASPYAVYNAYAAHPHKAKLEIKGDLEAMARNWTDEEWEARRRIVHFRRAQAGSVITTEFEPLALDERPSNAVCVSCIYWAEKQACFITSVDTIYLLEQLIAARFTVEEKNRIRRNLEGFRPFTVSKGRADSEEFFKLIMAFPNPKPRNIEKDVKVFQWKDLASALKKILSKYSASPASTMPHPTVPTPGSATSSYMQHDPSSSGRLYHAQDAVVSPRSTMGLKSSSSSSITQQHDQPSLHLMIPHTASNSGGSGGDGGGVWSGPPPHQHQHHHMAITPSPSYGGGGGRGAATSTSSAWDISNYLDSTVAASDMTTASGTAVGTGTRPTTTSSDRGLDSVPLSEYQRHNSTSSGAYAEEDAQQEQQQGKPRENRLDDSHHHAQHRHHHQSHHHSHDQTTPPRR